MLEMIFNTFSLYFYYHELIILHIVFKQFFKYVFSYYYSFITTLV